MITKENVVQIDGVGAFRIVEHDGVLFVQLKDWDRYRIKCRGSRFIQTPLHILLEKINAVQAKEKGNGRNATKPAQP